MISSPFRPDNRLLLQARRGERLTPIWLIIPLAFLIPLISGLGAIPLILFNLVSRGLANPTMLLALDEGEVLQLVWPRTAIGYALFLILSFGGVYLLLWLWIRFFEERPFKSLGFEGPKPGLKFGRGFLVGGILFAAPVIGMYLLGYYRFDPTHASGLNALGTTLLVLLGWLVQGPAEELLFRGWVLPVIAARYRLWLGVGLSALLFAVLHGSNPNVGPVPILNLFLFGLFAASYALREESIWGMCGLHAVWNWVQGNIFGLEVSGLRPPGGTLLALTESGPDLITGGAFGPEGGLMVTLVLVLSIVALVVRFNRQAGELKEKEPSEAGSI